MSVTVAAEAVSYRVGAKALVAEVSLAIQGGFLTAIVGPNGAGKSTLARLLSGELAPSSGTVRYGADPVGGIPGWRLACLRAVLPQSSRLAFPFRARDVVRIGIDGIGRGLGPRERIEILARALERADIVHLADRAYQTLSGGEQQRTQFARVLAQLAAGRSVAEGQTLILDEPTASLDLRHQLSLLDTASALARDGIAVVSVLHDLNLAAAYADEIVVMAGGRVVASGPPDRVLDDRLIREVFEVDLRVGEVPTGGRPFLLPRRLERHAREP